MNVKNIPIDPRRGEMTVKEADDIIDRLYDTTPLSHILPNPEQRKRFFNFLANNPSLASKYAMAQQSRAELHVEEIIDISDTELDANRARVRIDARKWYASKMQPQKYGDKLDLTVSTSVDINAALNDARTRVRSIRDLSGIEEAEVVEVKSQSCDASIDKESEDPPKKRDVGQNSVVDPFE